LNSEDAPPPAPEVKPTEVQPLPSGLRLYFTVPQPVWNLKVPSAPMASDVPPTAVA
jgi:hypothetical protein